MAVKQIVIAARERGFGMSPPLPEVKPGWEALEVRVDWSQNGGYWNEVVVGNFRLPNDEVPSTNVPSLTFDLGDARPQKLLFNFKVTIPIHCEFDVEMHRVDPPETIVIDPVIILQPGP